MRTRGVRGAFVLAMTALTCLFAAGVVAADNPWVDPDEIKIPKLNKIQEIKPERVELANGMVVYFLEDHEFPLVDVRALMRVGSVWEPVDKVGLAQITGTVMRTGGSEKTSGDALDETLESMGASVEVNIAQTEGFATVSTLSEDLDKGLKILAEVLRTPAFPEDKIDLAKKQERTAIASRNDEHLQITFREILKFIYGKDHPYARHTEYATIEAITRDDLVAFHKDYIHPDRIIMTVFGDFERDEVEELLNQIFGDWAKSTEPLPADPVVGDMAVTGVFLADKADLENSIVVVGQEGMRMDDPDYPAMQIFHELMGGGFSSRLFEEIRTNKGLAYAAGSFSGAGLHHAGPQGFYVMTQADSTVITLGYVREEIEKGLADGFTEEELQFAKDSILNSLVFTLSSKGSVLNRMATYEFYGYPVDFLTRYQEAIQNMTPEEVHDAAKRTLHYPDMATMIVGEKEKFEGDLAMLGTVTMIDISIPEPEGMSVPPATPEALARGQELMAAAATAAGAEVIAGLEDMTEEHSGTLSIQGMELAISTSTVRKFPDCERSEQKLPMGTVIQVVCGETAWMDAMQGPQAMPDDARANYDLQNERDLLKVLTAYQDYQFQALDEEAEVNGSPADVVFVLSDQVKNWRIFLDRETHRIVRMEYKDKNMMTGAPVMAQVNYKDYKDVGEGISWPHALEILHDGELLVGLDATSVQVNTGVDDAIFNMPE